MFSRNSLYKVDEETFAGINPILFPVSGNVSSVNSLLLHCLPSHQNLFFVNSSCMNLFACRNTLENKVPLDGKEVRVVIDKEIIKCEANYKLLIDQHVQK